MIMNAAGELQGSRSGFICSEVVYYDTIACSKPTFTCLND